MFTDSRETVGNYIIVTLCDVPDEDAGMVYLEANHDYGEPELVEYFPTSQTLMAKFPIA